MNISTKKTETTIAINRIGERFEVCNHCRTTKRQLQKGDVFKPSICECGARDFAKKIKFII